MKRNLKQLAALAAFMTLTACSFAPEYVRPDVAVPAQWQGEANSQPVSVNLAWWRQFDDEALSTLIGTALANNKDYLIAASRIEQASAQMGITHAARAPQLGGRTSAQTSQASQLTDPPAPNATRREDKQGRLELSFELDLWGKLRNATEADRQKLLASEYNRQNLRLSLISRVATGYFQLRALDRQLEVSIANLEAQEQTLHLTRRRFEAGVSSEYDYAQAKAQTAQTKASIPELKRRIAVQEDALSLLLGQNPGPIPRGKTLEQLQKTLSIPVGLPSSLLERRPDVLQAESMLRAGNAQIGVAKAAFFPSISLTGALGAESGTLADLTRSGARIWSAAFGMAQPIFTGGKLNSQLKLTEAQQKEYVLNYQKAAQTAFSDVEDGLANVRLTQEQVDDKKQRVENLKTAHKIALLRYQEGLTSFMDVLDAQRNSLQAELDLDGVRNQLLAAYVSLYQALGGGWTPGEVTGAN